MKIKFCLDTCSLITAVRYRYPPKTFQTLWERIGEAAGDNLVSPAQVLFELERKDDEVLKLIKTYNKMFRKENEELLATVSEILSAAPNLIDPHSTYEQADPFVIALAEQESAVVVSDEVLVGPGAKKQKIPNVCRSRGIECITFLEMIQRFKWTF